jgi:cell shape-determining protein MreC
MQNLNSQTIQLALVAAVALAMLIQAIVLFAALIALRKLASAIREEIEDFRASVMPVVDNTRNLVERIAPKIEATTEDLALLTRSLRTQAADVQTAASEIVARARQQATRVDEMLSSVLDAVDRAGTFMADTVAKPMRQFSAILASAKAVIESLRNAETAPRSPANNVSGENDHYV